MKPHNTKSIVLFCGALFAVMLKDITAVTVLLFMASAEFFGGELK